MEPQEIVSRKRPISLDEDRDERMRMQLSREIDFTKNWFKADVMIQTTDSDLIIYANRNYLATHSPVFDAMFYAGFAETDESTVNVSVKYSVMIEILSIIHMLDVKAKKKNKVYSVDELVDLYIAADQYDIEVVTELVKRKLRIENDRKKTMEAAIRLGLNALRSFILKAMTIEEIKEFLESHKQSQFTGDDILSILKKNDSVQKLPTSCPSCNMPLCGSSTYSSMMSQNECSRFATPGGLLRQRYRAIIGGQPPNPWNIPQQMQNQPQYQPSNGQMPMIMAPPPPPVVVQAAAPGQAPIQPVVPRLG